MIKRYGVLYPRRYVAITDLLELAVLMLVSQHPQLTAAEWEAVWVQHNETISRKVGQITRASEESAQPGGSSQSTKPERE